jgi:hypothetical protein
MKNTTFWGSVFVLFFLSLAPLRAGSPYDVPKWIIYLNGAGMYYNMGMGSLPDNPAAAIDSFTKAQQFAQKSLVSGGGQYAISLSKLIGEATLTAQKNLKNNSAASVAMSPPPVPNNALATKISGNGKSTVVRSKVTKPKAAKSKVAK